MTITEQNDSHDIEPSPSKHPANQCSQPETWVQLDLGMDLPPLEKRHRDSVKRRAEILWDRIQQAKQLSVAAPQKS